jgi:hypothetical protein
MLIYNYAVLGPVSNVSHTPSDVAAHQNTRFLVTRRFESEPSASSPKRSGGLSSRTCRRSCFVHDAAMRVNPSSASALIATADSATAAIFAGSRRGRNNDALLTGATSRQRLVEKPTSCVSAPEQIQFLLGHASVQTTERYCAQKGDMCSECPSLLIGKACASVDST